MKHLKSFSVAVLALSSLNIWAAQTRPTKAGQECALESEIDVISMSCINPRAGADVRLYVMEFQTCQNGTITELDRTLTGMNVVSNKSVDDIHTMDQDNIDITYADQRISIDPDNRVDNLSFVMPTSAVLKDGDTTVEMAMTTKTELDYEGASPDQFHFVGSFKIKNANGEIKKSGKLICSVNR